MGVVNFIISNKASFGMLTVAIIDFAWHMNPNLKSSGILHSIWTFAFGLEEPKA